MNEREAQRLITVLVTAFPSSTSRLSESQQAEFMGIYRRMLADLDYAAANAAVERLLATSRFMPTVAEVRETVFSLEQGEQRAGGEAWGTVLKAIRAEGVYRRPGIDFNFRDPVTLRVVSALSWEELCNSENITADRARFIELYDKLAIQERRKQLSESLPAMQRYREIEAKRTAQIEQRTSASSSSTANPFARVLSLVTGGES